MGFNLLLKQILRSYPIHKIRLPYTPKGLSI